MSSTPKSHPAVQRLNKAYVQVPASPLTSSRNRALSTSVHVAQSSKLKENTPLRPSLSAMQHSSASAPLKRKLSDRDAPSQVLDGVIISTKKSKLSIDATSAPLKSRQLETSTFPNNASEEFPNGFVYCHQCNKKRDAVDTIRCTVVERYQTVKSTAIKERMCVNKYCKHCLKNRYEEDIDKFKSQTSGKNGAMYEFKCPRCRDLCNCPRCRKSKGLEAIGFIPKAKPQPSASSLKGSKSKSQSSAKTKTKPNEPAIARVKELPVVKWTPLCLSLNREEVDDRIFIREFALRFGDFLDPIVAKSHIEELELIGGRARKQNEDNDGATWVSDMCIKALVVSLLGVLAKDHETPISQVIKSAVRDLRTGGMNLNKIWKVLERMRDDIAKAESDTSASSSEIEVPLTFPDPSPPPISAANARRSLRQSDTSVLQVTHSTQMIPVLLSLIHSALETSIIREEIDQGAKDARDFGTDARDATRVENERWEKERNSMEVAPKDKNRRIENRDKRAAHKLQISNIENALRIIVPSFSPRFTPLGTDNEGRVYYALFPGVSERESALEYLELAASGKSSKPKKKCPLPSTDERMEMREWSWFVAVWGKDSARGLANGNIGPDSDEDEDVDAEKWWGFWDPDDIARLAQWIAIKSGVDDDEESTSDGSGSASHKEKAALPPRLAQYKRLVTELHEYAFLLRWRIRDDKCSLIHRLPGNDQAI